MYLLSCGDKSNVLEWIKLYQCLIGKNSDVGACRLRMNIAPTAFLVNGQISMFVFSSARDGCVLRKKQSSMNPDLLLTFMHKSRATADNPKEIVACVHSGQPIPDYLTSTELRHMYQQLLLSGLGEKYRSSVISGMSSLGYDPSKLCLGTIMSCNDENKDSSNNDGRERFEVTATVPSIFKSDLCQIIRSAMHRIVSFFGDVHQAQVQKMVAIFVPDKQQEDVILLGFRSATLRCSTGQKKVREQGRETKSVLRQSVSSRSASPQPFSGHKRPATARASGTRRGVATHRLQRPASAIRRPASAAVHQRAMQQLARSRVCVDPTGPTDALGNQDENAGCSSTDRADSNTESTSSVPLPHQSTNAASPHGCVSARLERDLVPSANMAVAEALLHVANARALAKSREQPSDSLRAPRPHSVHDAHSATRSGSSRRQHMNTHTHKRRPSSSLRSCTLSQHRGSSSPPAATAAASLAAATVASFASAEAIVVMTRANAVVVAAVAAADARRAATTCAARIASPAMLALAALSAPSPAESPVTPHRRRRHSAFSASGATSKQHGNGHGYDRPRSASAGGCGRNCTATNAERHRRSVLEPEILHGDIKALKGQFRRIQTVHKAIAGTAEDALRISYDVNEQQQQQSKQHEQLADAVARESNAVRALDAGVRECADALRRGEEERKLMAAQAREVSARAKRECEVRMHEVEQGARALSEGAREEASALRAQVSELQGEVRDARARLELERRSMAEEREANGRVLRELLEKSDSEREAASAEMKRLSDGLAVAQQRLLTLGFKKYGAGFAVGLGLKTHGELQHWSKQQEKEKGRREHLSKRRFTVATKSSGSAQTKDSRKSTKARRATVSSTTVSSSSACPSNQTKSEAKAEEEPSAIGSDASISAEETKYVKLAKARTTITPLVLHSPSKKDDTRVESQSPQMLM